MVKRRREVSTDDEKNPSGEEMASTPVVAPVRSVDLDATRSQTDPKHYRLITLSNGLQAMLISDPRAPSGTHIQPPLVCVYRLLSIDMLRVLGPKCVEYYAIILIQFRCCLVPPQRAR
jgi:hypothetical protein